MALLEWSEKMSVGVDAMDADHKKLLSYVNELHGVIRGSNDTDLINRVLRDIITYTDYHFEAEERLMRLARYEGLEDHRRSHTELRDSVHALKTQYDVNPKATALKIFDFLSNWLMRHILGEDMRYKSALKAAMRPQT